MAAIVSEDMRAARPTQSPRTPLGAAWRCPLDPIADDAAASHTAHVTAEGRLEFPFAFPKPGSYTVWVQFRRAGTIHTAAFSLVVV